MNFELAFKAQFEGPLMMIRHDGMAIEGGDTGPALPKWE